MYISLLQSIFTPPLPRLRSPRNELLVSALTCKWEVSDQGLVYCLRLVLAGQSVTSKVTRQPSTSKSISLHPPGPVIFQIENYRRNHGWTIIENLRTCYVCGSRDYCFWSAEAHCIFRRSPDTISKRTSIRIALRRVMFVRFCFCFKCAGCSGRYRFIGVGIECRGPVCGDLAVNQVQRLTRRHPCLRRSFTQARIWQIRVREKRLSAFKFVLALPS